MTTTTLSSVEAGTLNDLNDSAPVDPRETPLEAAAAWLASVGDCDGGVTVEVDATDTWASLAAEMGDDGCDLIRDSDGDALLWWEPGTGH